MPKVIELNPGAQRNFVKSRARATAYIGGVGSGKTFAGLVKGLETGQQPVLPLTMFGPRGLIGASSEGVLKKVVLPQFFETMDGTGLWKTGHRRTSWAKTEMLARLTANCPCPDRHRCDHETEVYLASLHDPDEIRGMELSWYFIDEGRNVNPAAWDVLWGRLRQKACPCPRDIEEEVHPQYWKGGWVCSTSNGYDWMYETFHEDSTSDSRVDGAELYTAATMDNRHVGLDYIESLEAKYHGRFYEQEVLGHFVGMTEGAVFFEWDMKDAKDEVPYDTRLPLYSEWDFGMGDLNVVNFFQVAWLEQKSADPKRRPLLIPEKRYVGSLEGSNRISAKWAEVFNDYCDTYFYGARPKVNAGDPAGRQRNQVTGTSVVEDLALHGIVITCPKKGPIDGAIRQLNSMMARHGVKVDHKRCGRLAQAFASHRWPMNALGVRTGNTPVHDVFASHYCDAARYGTLVVIPPVPTEKPEDEPADFEPGQAGFIFGRVLERAADDEDIWLGDDEDPEPIAWVPAPIRARSA